MRSKDYYICDDLLYTLSQLSLTEKKTVYKATALNAWWREESRGTHAIRNLVRTLNKLHKYEHSDNPRILVNQLCEHWWNKRTRP